MQYARRELPETGVGRRHILGGLRLALIPPRGTRAAAQGDKSKMILSTKTIFATVKNPN